MPVSLIFLIDFLSIRRRLRGLLGRMRMKYSTYWVRRQTSPIFTKHSRAKYPKKI